MSALARYDFAPWSLSEAVVSDLARKGTHLFEDPVDPQACAGLLAEIRAQRRFDQSLFLPEPEPEPAAAPAGVPGREPAARLKARLAFVERAPQIVEAL